MNIDIGDHAALKAFPSRMLRRASINGVATALPTHAQTNDEFREELGEHKFALLVRNTGVLKRFIAAAGQTALDLGEEACRKLFDMHPELQRQVDTIIFCTQSPDHILPPNSCILHGRLGLPESVAAFDLPHACSAYIYGLNLAQALIAAGSANNVLLVTADTYSKFIHPLDRSARVLFGDGAAATWLSACTDERGVLDVACGTDGARYDRFIIPAGGCRQPLSDAGQMEEVRDRSGNVRTALNIHMSGGDILSFVGSRIPPHIHNILARNGVTLDEVDWLVFHQASSVVLDTLTTLLRAEPSKVLRNLEHVGNTVSASIPITLSAALEEGKIRSGQLLLLCGFGAGLSWGSALVLW